MKRIFTKPFAGHRLLTCMAMILLAAPPVFSSPKKMHGKEMPKNIKQAVTISGTVKDESGQPLPGVSILVKDTKVGTASDGNGNYKITVPDGGTTLVFTSAGFKKQEIAIGGRTMINVILSEDISKLNEVVITGYGSQSRETLTTAVAKLDTKVLENVPYTNATSALQGSIPGVRVQSVSGQPGATPRVVLRGGTTINNLGSRTASQPLYIVDGVIRPNLGDIAAEDIESMQVLKDAASTAIYGSRASDGVVLVTTKSGKSGAAQISYSYDLSVGDEGTRQLEYASAADYIYYGRLSWAMRAGKTAQNTINNNLNGDTGVGTGGNFTNSTAYTNQYLSPANQHKLNEGWQSVQDPIDPSKTIIFKETDYNKLRQQRAISHNHFLSASGGGDKAKYNLSAGYLDGQGTALDSYYNRFTANLNGTLQVNPKLSVSGRVLYAATSFRFLDADTDRPFTELQNVFQRNAAIPGSAKYQFEDGTLAPGPGGSSRGNPDYYQVGPFAPVRKNRGEDVTIGLSGKWDIAPGLSFAPLLSLLGETTYGRQFQPAYLAGAAPSSFTTQRRANQYHSRDTYYQADGVFTYVKSWAEHNLDAKAGYSYYNRSSWDVNAIAEGAATDLIPTLNGSVTPILPTGDESQFITQGFFGAINYNFNEKYLLYLTGRYDGASNLGENNRYAFFPGASIGWNLHRESFWTNIPKQISSVKIRASYGETGKTEGLGNYTWQGLYNPNVYNNTGAVTTNAIENPDLKWEHSRTFDMGLDLGLFDNRISVIFDYFDRKTDNLIASVLLPLSSGFNSVLTNNGSLGSKGVEFDLNAKIMPSASKFQWTVNFNASKVKSSVLSLPFNGRPGNNQNGFQIWDPSTNALKWVAGLTPGANDVRNLGFIEGRQPGDMYAFKQIGIYATDAEAAAGPYDEFATADLPELGGKKTKYGGDVNWLDVDGNHIINDNDRVYAGNMFPTWTGGFSNYFTYKGFGLNVRTDFTLGHTIYNYGRVFADANLQGDLLPTKDFVEKSWKKQGDITNTPRYIHQAQNNVARNLNYYEKGDFLCIREVTVSYTLPATLLRKVKMGSVRINLTGNNLHYFTKYTGANPEEGGPDNGHYPNQRAIILGANIAF